jgi:hypothetical protein
MFESLDAWQAKRICTPHFCQRVESRTRIIRLREPQGDPARSIGHFIGQSVWASTGGLRTGKGEVY